MTIFKLATKNHNFTKILFQEKKMNFDAKKSAIFPEGVFIIGTYDENSVPNAMNAAWGIQSDYEEITLYLAKHKTTENIKKTKAFTVAFGTKSTVAISDYFGIESGENVNKIEKAGCHVHKAPHVNAPIIEEYPVSLECECKSFNDETGILVGKIVGQIADDSVITNGTIDIEKLEPLVFDMATKTYRTIGPVAGYAWKDGLAIKNKNS